MDRAQRARALTHRCSHGCPTTAEGNELHDCDNCAPCREDTIRDRVKRGEVSDRAAAMRYVATTVGVDPAVSELKPGEPDLTTVSMSTPAQPEDDDALVELAKDLVDFGLRFDLNPTQYMGPDAGKSRDFWARYMRNADESIRLRAAEALRKCGWKIGAKQGTGSPEAKPVWAALHAERAEPPSKYARANHASLGNQRVIVGPATNIRVAYGELMLTVDADGKAKLEVLEKPEPTSPKPVATVDLGLQNIARRGDHAPAYETVYARLVVYDDGSQEVQTAPVVRDTGSNVSFPGEWKPLGAKS